MQLPEYDNFGGWSLIIRPEPVSYTVRKPRPSLGITFKFGVLKINKLIATSALFLAAFGANAAVPTNVSDAITGAATDAAAVAALAFLVVVGVYAIKKMRTGL